MDSISITVSNPSAPRGTDSLTSTLVSSHSPASSQEASSSSGSSDEDGSEEEDSDSSSDDESDGEDETAARLKSLLLKAKESARAKASAAKAGLHDDGLAANDEVVLFGDDDDEDDGDEQDGSTPRPKAHKIAPSLVRPLTVKAPTAASLANGDSKGKGKAVESTAITLGQDVSGSVESSDRWGRAPLPSLSAKERRARHAPTAGPKWFNMPAPVMTAELKREVQAMRLRNALDPKRFYKGGAKDSKTLPEFFQFGHIIPSASGSVSTAQQGRVRKRTFVEELVQDEQASAYARKKYQQEIQPKGMSGRKGKGKKKGERRK